MKYEYQKNAPTEYKSNFGARIRNKVMSQAGKFAGSGGNSLTEMEKFLQVKQSELLYKNSIVSTVHDWI